MELYRRDKGEGETSAHPEPLKRRGRIVLSLLGVLIIAGLGPLATVSFKLIETNKEALKTAQQQYQLLLASSAATEVDNHISGLRAQLPRIARALSPALVSGGFRSRQLKRELEDSVDEWMLYVRYTDVKGRWVDSQGSEETPLALDPLFASAFERTLARAKQHPESGSRLVTVSEPFTTDFDPSRSLLILASPVYHRAQPRGVVCAVVDLQSVWDTVLENHRTGHTIFILDGKGRLFGSSDAERAGDEAHVRESEIVQRFLSAEGRSRETLPFHWKEQGRDVRYLGSFERTPQGWGVFVLARERQVYAPVRAMVRDTLSWALAALALAILAAVFFAGTLSKPINRLAAAAREFAAGRFNVRVQARARNEIGELAEVFNRMAAKIEDDIRELKRAAQENDELFMGTIRALAQAIDAKDPYTRGHSVRVNKYSVIIARYLGLDEREIRDIHVASLLHDVGKIGVDDRILKKPGALTTEEFAVMKTHTVLGANIMSPIKQMKKVIPGLRSHHERMNGQGYPDQMVGGDIPLMARIIAVADTFDAMTTHRPYQQASSFDVARAKINELRKVAFDERVVEAFNRAYLAGDFEGEVEEPAGPGDDALLGEAATA